MPHVVIYARKSTESEDRQVLSIESQVKELREHATRAGVAIHEVLRESKSAKAPGRPVFSELLESVNTGEINGILCWKLDRLARNPVDGGALIWALETDKLVKIITPGRNFENTGDDKFWMQLEFGMAKKYVDDLSANVKRGLRAKLEQGWKPGPPPVGYMNDLATKTIVADPARFPLVRRMWDMMLTGAYSPPQILEIATKQWGLRGRQFRRSGGGVIARSTGYMILTNPFYYGMIVYAGQRHPGAHQPMVSKEEFDRVQAIIRSRSRPRPSKLTFTYTGCIRCGECGASITAENKRKILRSTDRVKTYVYYHCTKRKPGVKCSQRVIEEEELEAQIVGFLGTLRIGEPYLKWVFRMLDSLEGEEQANERAVAESLRGRVRACERELSELTNLRLRKLIEDGEFTTKRNDLQVELVTLRQRIDRPKATESQTIGKCRAVFEFADSAVKTFQHGDSGTKKALLKQLGSNHTLLDRTLRISAEKPFQIIHKFTAPSHQENRMFEPAILGLDSTRTVTVKDGSCALLGVVDDVRTAVRDMIVNGQTLYLDNSH